MAYVLEAFIAKPNILSAAILSFESAEVVLLKQDLALMPLTNRFFDEFHEPSGASEGKYRPEFWKLTTELESFGKEASIYGRLCYVEAEFFGGIGTQASIGWEHGKLGFSPLHFDENTMSKLLEGPINQALRWLGAHRGNHLDEFTALNLGKHRHTSEWATRSEEPDEH